MIHELKNIITTVEAARMLRPDLFNARESGISMSITLSMLVFVKMVIDGPGIAGCNNDRDDNVASNIAQLLCFHVVKMRKDETKTQRRTRNSSARLYSIKVIRNYKKKKR